jgi:hypothetical protein
MEPNSPTPKSARPKGRPRRADAPKVPWPEVDRILVHGESQVDPDTGQEVLRYPSLVELAGRYGVSRTRVWTYANKYKCYERRREAQVKTMARTDDKLIEKLSESRAIATTDVLRIVDQYLIGFEKELQEGRVKTDSAMDFDRLVRLRELLVGGADSRTEVMGGITLVALQERHRQLRAQVDGSTPALTGTGAVDAGAQADDAAELAAGAKAHQGSEGDS